MAEASCTSGSAAGPFFVVHRTMTEPQPTVSHPPIKPQIDLIVQQVGMIGGQPNVKFTLIEGGRLQVFTSFQYLRRRGLTMARSHNLKCCGSTNVVLVCDAKHNLRVKPLLDVPHDFHLQAREYLLTMKQIYRMLDCYGGYNTGYNGIQRVHVHVLNIGKVCASCMVKFTPRSLRAQALGTQLKLQIQDVQTLAMPDMTGDSPDESEFVIED